MKFTCTQENLLSALDLVTPITGKNLSLPILNNVLIKTEDSEIVLSSTNLEIAVTSRVRGKIEAPGTITLNGKLLRDFISLQPQGKIQIKIVDGDAHIQSPSSKTVVKGMSSDDFPLIPTIEEEKNNFSIDVSKLKNLLLPILPTITFNESRPEISGVLFSFKNKTLTIVGTDSYRLAEASIDIANASFLGDYIVPLRTIQETLKVFQSGNIECVFTENQLLFQNEKTKLISRLIEGSYPDYKQIIPEEEKSSISLSREEFIQAVKSASLFCKSGINDIEVSTKKEEKLLLVVAANNQVGENITTIPAVITGDDTSIVFNFRYVLDALNTIHTDEVLLSLNGPNTTGVLRPSDDKKLLHLIMPIRQ